MKRVQSAFLKRLLLQTSPTALDFKMHVAESFRSWQSLSQSRNSLSFM